MEDIVQAIAAVARTAGEIGMTRDDLGKARDLLQKYGDERDRLFDQMQALLSKSDADSIVDDWKNNCKKGNDLLESLNSDMPNSPSGEGLNGVGARDFYEGEKKVWAENAKGQLALVANVIARVNAANTGLIQQCNDDLKTIRDSDAEAQSTLNGNIVQKTDENFKAAQQKGALRKQILDKIELLNNAREQLDEKWIDDMYRSGEEGAKSLPGSGETGDYRALDWARFGQSCTEPWPRVATLPKSRPKRSSKRSFRPSRSRVPPHSRPSPTILPGSKTGRAIGRISRSRSRKLLQTRMKSSRTSPRDLTRRPRERPSMSSDRPLPTA
jgi:hypothetical protein